MNAISSQTATYRVFLFVAALPESPELRHLFSLLDDNGSGEIDFREYLLGLGLLDTGNKEAVISMVIHNIYIRVYICRNHHLPRILRLIVLLYRHTLCTKH